MTRLLLAVLALLVGLLVLSRLRHTPTGPPAARPGAVVHAPLQSDVSTPASVAAVLPESTESRTSSIDLLARLEARRRLIGSAPYVYFDSLFTETDSIVRRWPDREGVPFQVAIPALDSAALDTKMRVIFQRALTTWEGVAPGLRFNVVPDSTAAQLVLTSARQLGPDRAGQTDLEWTRDGSIRSAHVTLARNDPEGHPNAEAGLFAVAVHEIGHALGLGHSPDPGDVMFHATRNGKLSARDQATMRLLYELPLGTIKEVSPP